MEQRRGFHCLYVILATHLSSDPVDEEDSSNLRADASTGGVCYLRVIRPLHDGTYLVRVAKSPELLGQAGYNVLLAEDQLASALPWDCRLQGEPPEHLFRTCQFRGLAQMLVQAALIAMKTAISKETSVTKGLFEQLHQAILRVSPLLQRCSQQLVHLSETYRGDQQIGWYVQINLPWFLLAV
jgi:hypothetical protein